MSFANVAEIASRNVRQGQKLDVDLSTLPEHAVLATLAAPSSGAKSKLTSLRSSHTAEGRYLISRVHPEDVLSTFIVATTKDESALLLSLVGHREDGSRVGIVTIATLDDDGEGLIGQGADGSVYAIDRDGVLTRTSAV